MSTILKALRRLEEQRRVEDKENLRERILASAERDAAEPSRIRRAGKVLLLTLAAGIVLAAGSFGVWRGLGDVADTDVAIHTEMPAPGRTLAARALESSESLPSVSAPPPPRPSVPPAAPAVTRAAPTQASTADSIPASPPPARPIPETPVSKAVDSKLAADIALITRPRKPVEARPAPVAVPAAIATAPEPLPIPAALAAAAPPIRRIERAPLPEFVVKRIEWHPHAARRMVLIDQAGETSPRPYGEGENLGVLEIIEIAPTSVLFRRDGVEIRRRVGR